VRALDLLAARLARHFQDFVVIQLVERLHWGVPGGGS
jgi:hypothetical protein